LRKQSGNCSDPNGKAPVYNGTDQPIVVGGGSGAGSGHGPDSVYVQMPLAPGQVVDANHPLIDANGNQLTDVDAVDFNGDGIAQQPTSNMSYLTGEKVPGTDQGVITPTDNLRINVYNILGISVPVIVPNTPIQTPTQSPTSSVDEETSSAAADGGFVLYPNMSNTNQMRSVYSKH